tara:strand:- start:507 stop:848 length:342 start_codon:yes stop_codon:yes gene_type:complete
MITKILVDRTNYKTDIDDIRNAWLEELLLYLGADTDWLSTAPKDLAVEYFLQNNLEIIKHFSIDALEVRHEGELVGEWGGPSLKMIEDPQGDLYYEAEIEHWTIMEEDMQENI